MFISIYSLYIHMYSGVCIYVWVSECVHVCVCMCVHVCACVCARARVSDWLTALRFQDIAVFKSSWLRWCAVLLLYRWMMTSHVVG